MMVTRRNKFAPLVGDSQRKWKERFMFDSAHVQGRASDSKSLSGGGKKAPRVYAAPSAIRLDVGATAAGEPDIVPERGVFVNGKQQYANLGTS